MVSTAFGTDLKVPFDILIADAQMLLAGASVTETACTDMYVVETGNLVHLTDTAGQINRGTKEIILNILSYK